jgi:hypothetical protein
MFNVNHKGNVIVNVTTVNGSKTVTPAAMTGIKRGQTLVATGVPAGAYVDRVDTTTIEISAAATASATVSGRFDTLPDVVLGIPVYKYKGAFAADYSTLGLPTPPYDFALAVTYNTDDTNKVRLYVYAFGAWKYEELS